MKRKILLAAIIISVMGIVSGCLEQEEYTERLYSPNATTEATGTDASQPVHLALEALFYNNNGEMYMNVEGNEFTLTPNKVEEWAYDSSGSWIKSYSLSSVMTVEIDGKFIENCGNTVIFKDRTLQYMDVAQFNLENLYAHNPSENVTYSSWYKDYCNLRCWWSEAKEAGQNGTKIVLIQSQEGNPIGILSGNNVTWRLAEKLPKTTKIEIDGKGVYIHRANFQIIDAELLAE